MTKQAFKDLLARAGWTAGQAFLAVFVVEDLSTAKKAAVAGIAAAISVVKSFVGAHTGSSKDNVTFT